MRKFCICIITIFYSFYSMASYASVQNDLAKVWESLGGESTTNGANFYKGQKAGHYTLGSMYFARQKKNRPLISINPPEIDIDKSCYNQGVLNFGGMSFISGDEIKNKLTSISQQAGLMFAYLGISSISPVIGETLQEVYSKLQELGGFLADECQTAKQIVSFAGNKLAQHSEIAKDIFAKHNLSQGKQNDLSNSYEKFPSGKTAALSDLATKDERYIIEDINLAWKAIDKLKIDSKEIKELMMTMSGTVIIKAAANDNAMPTFQYVSPLIVSPTNLEALLKGGKDMKLISCSDQDKCLNVLEKNKFIEVDNSFENKVNKYLNAIQTALKEDKELEQSTQKFLSNAGLPAYAIYDVLYQFTNGNPEYEQGMFVEVIAWNILYNYLSDMLKEVNEAANNLQIAASEELKEFKESIRNAQKLLSDHEMKDLSRYKLQLFLVKRAENMENVIADEISEALSFARNN